LLVEDQGQITAIGIGSAGIKIVSLLSRKSLLVDRYAYISCDDADFSTVDSKNSILVESPVDQKLTPSIVRGLAIRSHRRIRDAVGGSKVVFIVAGLGGATGSGLAPLVASIAQECGAKTVGVAVMPFEFEKRMKFYAGVSLRRLREASRGVIVIDNDTLMRSSPEDSTLTSLYDSANKAAVKALGSLLSKSSQKSKPIGLNKLLGAVLQDGYSLLGVSSSGAADKAEDALAGAVVSLGKLAEAKEANRAVVSLNGDTTLAAREVGLAVNRLGSMMDNEEVDVEYGVDYSGSGQLQVSLLASGFRSTKYDDYDPLVKILGGRVLDDEMDASLPEGLEALPPCD
jgi:cell division protein FtsZ